MLAVAVMNLCVLIRSVMSGLTCCEKVLYPSVSIEGKMSVAGRSDLSPGFLPLRIICLLYDAFPLNVGGIQEYSGHCTCDYVTLYIKRDISDVTKVLYQLTLS